MPSVRTASGRTLTIDQLSNAEAAIRTIASNNSLLLSHSYDTSRDDVEALVDLAHERWFELSKRGDR